MHAVDSDTQTTELAHTLPVYGQLGIEPVRGEGCKLITHDGREILDLYGGHAVSSVGYGHPGLVKAIAEQAGTLTFQSNAVPMAVRARAAEALTSFAPPGLDRAFLVNSGAEANENALRLVLRVTGRSRVVALEGAFHGRLAGCGAVTWGSRDGWYGFPRTPFDVTFVPVDDIEALRAAVDRDTAAVILEPVQGVAGARDLDPAFVKAARGITRDAGSLLIFDEVQVGMGRSGRPFAADHFGVVPDVLTTAKGLAGGFPAGAVLTTDDIAGRLAKGDLGTTFGGGPMACAAIAAVIEAINSEGLLANVREREAQVRATCRVGPVTDIQGLGLLLGLRTTRPAKETQAALLDRDILAGSSGDPHVLRLLPPLTLEAAHVEQLAAALHEIGS